MPPRRAVQADLKDLDDEKLAEELRAEGVRMFSPKKGKKISKSLAREFTKVGDDKVRDLSPVDKKNLTHNIDKYR